MHAYPKSRHDSAIEKGQQHDHTHKDSAFFPLSPSVSLSMVNTLTLWQFKKQLKSWTQKFQKFWTHWSNLPTKFLTLLQPAL